MPTIEEDKNNLIKKWNKLIDDGEDTHSAFKKTVTSLLNSGHPEGEIRRFFGNKGNASLFKNFHPSFNRFVSGWIEELRKVQLNIFLEEQGSSINKLTEIMTIYYLRHLQELEWEEEEDYISYDRVFGAENYSFPKYSYDDIPTLTVKYFVDYQGIDLGPTEVLNEGYLKEISEILPMIIQPYGELNLSQRIRKLQEFARQRDYLPTFIESPDRLLKMPEYYDEPASPGWGDKNQRGAVRFAPTPNGPVHIGHGRGISLLEDYANEYDMEFHLRFDDTNQDADSKSSNLPYDYMGGQDVYEHIIEDVTWIIGREPDKIIYASDKENLLRYEAAARELIKKGYAFVLFEIVRGKKYEYGKSPEENLKMFEKLLSAGANPPWGQASVILGVGAGYNNAMKLYMRNPPNEETQSDHIKRVKREVRQFIEDNIYSGEISFGELFSLNVTENGSKFMRNQEKENIRVIKGEGGHKRGAEQWAWPTLSLQSVIDDKYYGVTHALRGTDYDLEVAEKTKKFSKDKGDRISALGIIHTISFQGILRMLLKAPPVYTASNWGNVSWDGQIWDYDKSKEPPLFLNKKTSSMSTSTIRAGIKEGKYEGGFLNERLPTIYSLRVNPYNRGSSFKFYWTRFNLPNNLNPIFIRKDYETLNESLRQVFPGKEGVERLKEKNEEITETIEKLQEEKKYLAEDYSSSE